MIREMQREHADWVNHNFPDQQDHDGLLGIAEETGELAHAHLKYQQGIRGMSRDEYRRQAGDALGDLFIYMMSYANTNGFDLQACIEGAWGEVKNRDWQSRPETG